MVDLTGAHDLTGAQYDLIQYMKSDPKGKAMGVINHEECFVGLINGDYKAFSPSTMRALYKKGALLKDLHPNSDWEIYYLHPNRGGNPPEHLTRSKEEQAEVDLWVGVLDAIEDLECVSICCIDDQTGLEDRAKEIKEALEAAGFHITKKKELHGATSEANPGNGAQQGE